MLHELKQSFLSINCWAKSQRSTTIVTIDGASDNNMIRLSRSTGQQQSLGEHHRSILLELGLDHRARQSC